MLLLSLEYGISESQPPRTDGGYAVCSSVIRSLSPESDSLAAEFVLALSSSFPHITPTHPSCGGSISPSIHTADRKACGTKMTTSGGTRAARAATSRKVKQDLVNLLFGKEFRRSGPEGHRKLDYSIYSYDDLRKAYLQKLHLLHPDKQRSSSFKENYQTHRKEFQRLQDVWSQYDEMAKSMMKVAGGDGESANFTMFGVGCSFSDNEAERALRNDITDQACRGWFSSGLLAEHDNQPVQDGPDASAMFKRKATPLVDDSLFVDATNDVESDDREASPREPSRPRTLIPGVK